MKWYYDSFLFPRMIDVTRQGFAAVHELVMDATPSAQSGANGDCNDKKGLTDAIVDHDPSAFRPRSSNKDGDASGHSNTSGGGMVGLLFPLPSPIWARIGAADSSSTPEDSERGEGRLTSEPRSKTNSPSSRGGRGDGGVDGGGERGHDAKTKAPPGGGGDGAGNGFFNTAGVFRGMNMNMGMNMNVASIFKGGGGEGGDTGNASPAGVSTTTAPDADSSRGATAFPLEAKQSEPKKGEAKTAADIAARWGVSFGRLGSRGDGQKREGEATSLGVAKAGVGGNDSDSGASKKETGFGSLFRKVS